MSRIRSRVNMIANHPLGVKYEHRFSIHSCLLWWYRIKVKYLILVCKYPESNPWCHYKATTICDHNLIIWNLQSLFKYPQFTFPIAVIGLVVVYMKHSWRWHVISYGVPKCPVFLMVKARGLINQNRAQPFPVMITVKMMLGKRHQKVSGDWWFCCQLNPAMSSKNARMHQRNGMGLLYVIMKEEPHWGCAGLFLCQLDTSWSHQRGGSSIEKKNASVRLSYRQGNLQDIFSISDWWRRAQPIVGGATPRLLVLGSIRKQAEQATRGTSK